MFELYENLYKEYGGQGWWPLFSAGGYHRNDYSYPRCEDDIWEIVLGVILTQNTTFTAVSKSLDNLKSVDALSYQGIKELPIDKLKQLIRPSGYFNQKTSYILEFINFFDKLNGRIPSREELLGVKGIGAESADSILLYAYKEPHFIVDTYTKRIFLDLNFIDKKAKYSDIKELVENELKKNINKKDELVKIYQEFHAILVEHAKRFYSKNNL